MEEEGRVGVGLSVSRFVCVCVCLSVCMQICEIKVRKCVHCEYVHAHTNMYTSSILCLNTLLQILLTEICGVFADTSG